MIQFETVEGSMRESPKDCWIGDFVRHYDLPSQKGMTHVKYIPRFRLGTYPIPVWLFRLRQYVSGEFDGDVWQRIE